MFHRKVFFRSGGVPTEVVDGFTYGRATSAFWLPTLCGGLFFIFAAVLLILKPELLAFFVAGIFLFIGIGLLSTALILRKARNTTIL